MKFPVIYSEKKEVKEIKVIQFENYQVDIILVNGAIDRAVIYPGHWVDDGPAKVFYIHQGKETSFDISTKEFSMLLQALDFLKEQSNDTSLKGFTEEEQDEISEYNFPEASAKIPLEERTLEKNKEDYEKLKSGITFKSVIKKIDEIDGVKNIREMMEEFKKRPAYSELIEQKKPEHAVVSETMKSIKKAEKKEHKAKVDALIIEGSEHMKKNEWYKAINCFQKVLALDPENKYALRDSLVCDKWIGAMNKLDETKPKESPTEPSAGLDYNIPEL